MRPLLLIGIAVIHLIFAGLLYAIFGLGQTYAPELMASPVMSYPMIIGVAGLWIWFTFWSVGKILEPGGASPPETPGRERQ